MRIALVAGETSGDQLGVGLIEQLKLRFPNAQFYGIGGPRMRQAGMDALYDMDEISMIGLDGVFSKLWKIILIRRNLFKTIIKDKPALFIGIDVPDFNLGLELKLSKQNVTTIHYVSPTIWAWRPSRIEKIKSAVSHMLVLFPFEKKIYDNNNIPATVVGHPLADQVDQVADMRTCRDIHQLDGDDSLIALLPGSRHSEIERHAALFLDTAEKLSSDKPQLKFVISAVNDKAQEYLQNLIDDNYQSLPIKIIKANVREVISASNLVLAASGTVTLETALMGKPLVMAYKVSKMTEWMVKTFAKVDYYAMPNFLLDRPRIPEFVQQQATADNLVAALTDYLDHPEKQIEVVKEFRQMKNSLQLNADVIASEIAANYLECGQ